MSAAPSCAQLLVSEVVFAFNVVVAPSFHRKKASATALAALPPSVAGGFKGARIGTFDDRWHGSAPERRLCFRLRIDTFGE
jgi:hypothetical protein